MQKYLLLLLTCSTIISLSNSAITGSFCDLLKRNRPCEPGFYRHPTGGDCVQCECNGHADRCDPTTGVCIDCQHNTEGDHCERCRSGYEGDARRGTPSDCQLALARPPCDCNNHSPRGCDSFCEHFTEGIHCESCKKGFYGNATAGTPYDCTPCPCPGGADCFVDKNGQVSCRNCPAGYAGRLCDTCAPGYAKSATTGGRECEPIGHVEAEKIQFVGDFPNRRRRLTYKINAYLSRRH